MKLAAKVLAAILLIGVVAIIYVRQSPETILQSLVPTIVGNIVDQSGHLEPDDKIHLYTVGTSSPLPSARANTCQAVFVNGHFFVFDVGDGGVRKMELMNLPITEVEAIFITHYHSDHYIELPHLINRSWILGRQKSLDVYGPTGLDTIMQGISTMLSFERKHRIDHHGDLMDGSIAMGISHEFEVSDDSSTVVYQKDGIRITAFDVRHEPVTPDVGYRIEYDGKTLVLSGDTNNSENLIRNAKNADILVHEVQANEIIKMLQAENEKQGQARNAQILHDILDYHTDLPDVLEIGDRCNVGKLVLSHLNPPPDNFVVKKFYEKAMRKYPGEVYLANDGDYFVIE